MLAEFERNAAPLGDASKVSARTCKGYEERHGAAARGKPCEIYTGANASRMLHNIASHTVQYYHMYSLTSSALALAARYAHNNIASPAAHSC